MFSNSEYSFTPNTFRIYPLNVVEIHKNGTVELFPSYYTEGLPDYIIPGNYSIRFIDIHEKELLNISFDAPYEIIAEPIGQVPIDFAPFRFALEYPMLTSKVVLIHHDTILIEFNPITRLLNDTVNLIPNQGFNSNPEEKKKKLLDQIKELEFLINEENFVDAENKLNEIKLNCNDWIIDDYQQESPLEPTKSDLIQLIDAHIIRLNKIKNHKISPNQPPVANAGGPYISNESCWITFDASGSNDPEGDLLYYRWDFDNDGIADTFWQTAPTTEYMLFSWYDDFSGIAKVEVSDGTTTTTAIASLTVNNLAPTVNAGPDQRIGKGENIFFNGSFNDSGLLDGFRFNDHGLIDGGFRSITWDFGDGSSEVFTPSYFNGVYSSVIRILKPTHVYVDNGEYTVTLTVTDDDGGIGTDTLIVTVNNVASNDTPPVPSIDIEKYVWGVGWEDADTAPGPSFSSGPVKFKIVVTNTGKVPLIRVNVTDDKYGPITISNTTLAAGAAIEAEYNISWVSGQQVNTADVEGYYGDTKYTDSDDAHYYGPISQGAQYDNILSESSSCVVFSDTSYLAVGKSKARSRDVMLFDLSMYNKDDTISKATLSLFWYYPAGQTRTSDTVVEIYRPQRWDSKHVTWYYRLYRTAWSPVGGAWFDVSGTAQGNVPYASVTFPASTVPDNQYHDFDVTQLVQEYVSGKYKNTGFFLKARTESGNYIAFYSSEWSNTDHRPKLTITR